MTGTGGIIVQRTGIQWGLKRALKSGLKIVEPKKNELQIDLDGARAVRKYGMQFSILRKAGLTKKWRETIQPSKKSGHVHVTIKLPSKINDLHRVLLQAVLGSDIRREAFNYCRVSKRNKYPIVFFEES
jgi:hypothetical protein